MILLLAQGWGKAKVKERVTRYAHPLVDAGVTFAAMREEDKPEVHALIDAHVEMEHGWKVSPESGGVVVRDKDGALIGTVLVGAGDFPRQMGPSQILGLVRAVAVDPAWRGRGVGVVALGMVERVFHENRPDYYVGNCKPEDARFYQKLGYTVLQPESEFPLALGDEVVQVAISNPRYPCCFFRTA